MDLVRIAPLIHNTFWWTRILKMRYIEITIQLILAILNPLIVQVNE